MYSGRTWAESFIQGKCIMSRRSNPDLSIPLCTWALSKFSWWTLAEKWSPAGLITHTLHVLRTWLLHTRIIGPWTHTSCGKGKRSMIRILKDSSPNLWIVRNCQGLGHMWFPVSCKGATQEHVRQNGQHGVWVPSEISVSVNISMADWSMIRAKANPELILLGLNMPELYLGQFQLKSSTTPRLCQEVLKVSNSPVVTCEGCGLTCLLQPLLLWKTWGQIVRDVSSWFQGEKAGEGRKGCGREERRVVSTHF